MGQQFTNAEGEQTEIDVAELQEWYKKFVVECPSGTLFMHEFKRFFGVQDNHEAAEYIENMFRAFDKNGVSCYNYLSDNLHFFLLSFGGVLVQFAPSLLCFMRLMQGWWTC